MTAAPKHREISRELIAEIATGKYGPGDRIPSEPQLVKRFGVSRPTVMRALRDLQAEGLIERRAGSGTYVRKRAGPSTARKQLGMLVPARATTEILETICGELANLARAHDYPLLWGGPAILAQDQNLNAQEAIKIAEQFIEQRLAGVFFAPFELGADQEKINRATTEKFRTAGVSLILLDRDFTHFPQRSDFDLVGIDNFLAGSLGAEHLIKMGCQHLAFVTRPHSASTVDARIAGVRETLLRHGLEADPNWVQFGDPADVKFVRSLTAARRWDGFICANDLTAAGLMRTLQNVNVNVPRDVRVVGFDDGRYAALLGVPLTTIHQPCRDIALIAFRAMLERIAEPTLPFRTLLLTPHLVVRESCGAYLSAKPL